MKRIKSLKIDTSRLLVDSSGYLVVRQSGQCLHLLLARSKLRDDFDRFVDQGFDGFIDDLDHVAHLDDDKFNCNLDNLLKVPQAWKRHLRKAAKPQLIGKKWVCRVSIAQSSPYYTVSVSDPEEALLQYDILKVTHCVDHVKLSPLIAQRLIFHHGLARPATFVDRGYYDSMDALLSHAGDWTKGT